APVYTAGRESPRPPPPPRHRKSGVITANLAAGSPGRLGNSLDSPAILPLTPTRTVLPSAGRGEVSWPETRAGIRPETGLICPYCLRSSRAAVAPWSRVTGPTEVGG